MSADEIAESTRVLEAMEAHAKDFYRRAVGIGHHQWIEMTGLLNEYCKMCRQELSAGRDFLNQEIDPPEYMVRYVLEKLDCMFGEAFARKAKEILRSDEG